MSAVRQSEQLHRSLLDSLPVPFFRVDQNGHCLDANSALLAMLGLPLGQALCRPISDYLPGELAERVQAECLQILQTGQPLQVRERACVTRTGRSFILDSVKVPVRDAEGKPISIQGVLLDVTPARPGRTRLAAERGEAG